MKRSLRKNGTGRNSLEQALTQLIQNQAEFVRDMEIRRTTDANLAEIRKDMDIIKGYLIRHEGYLEKPPEAIRDKIGFQEK